MNPAHKTTAILLLAGIVAGSAALLTRHTPLRRASADAADSSGLTIQARLQSTHIMQGVGETHMAITLQAPAVDGAQARPPVNLAVVIDRSGSMSGDKLLHAKEAARQLVSQLRATDRVAIVSYGSDVTLVLPSTRATAQAKAAAFHAIAAIYDNGGTNLSGGLIQGREQIELFPEAGAVERVVLISDGQANEGIVHPDGLAQLATETAQRGVSITTVGVGLDFDERVMTRIAVSGRGNYYFAENSFALAQMFTQELDRLAATAATHVHLTLHPAPGVEVLEAYGYPMTPSGQDILIPVADLHSGESRKVVVRLRVNAASPGTMKVADIGASFRPTSSVEARSISIAAHTAVTEQERLVLEGRDIDAIRHIERARTAHVINEATIQYESGNAGAALQMIQRQQQQTRSLALDLGDGEFAAEMERAGDSVSQDFRAAPAASSSEGKRARKANRKRAYDMMH
jgi:Ca-activated chloride channel family protein